MIEDEVKIGEKRALEAILKQFKETGDINQAIIDIHLIYKIAYG